MVVNGSRQKAWKKCTDFQAAIPLKGKELSDLLEASDPAGSVAISSVQQMMTATMS